MGDEPSRLDRDDFRVGFDRLKVGAKQIKVSLGELLKGANGAFASTVRKAAS
jgi:hypothetical protein